MFTDPAHIKRGPKIIDGNTYKNFNLIELSKMQNLKNIFKNFKHLDY